MACSYEHTGTFNPSRSYIKVFTFHHEGRFAPYTCTQCDEAWCMRACPVDAITVDMATGAKVIHDDKCVGCKVCTIACPFGTVNYSQATGKRTGPVTTECWHRRPRACLLLKQPLDNGGKESCHGQEKS
jgi:Fe-S-cluster-containing hydrogenase component 2